MGAHIVGMQIGSCDGTGRARPDDQSVRVFLGFCFRLLIYICLLLWSPGIFAFLAPDHHTSMIELNGNLGTHDFQKVIVEGGSVQISAAVLTRVRISFEFLSAFAENKVIYGVNTGFGPMAQYRIPEDRKTELQYNLIRSHCTGAGEMIPPQAVSYTHLRAHETVLDLVCRLLLEKKKYRRHHRI